MYATLHMVLRKRQWSGCEHSLLLLSQCFAERPLSAIGLDTFVTLRSRSEQGLGQVSGAMPFDLKRHPAVKTKITQVRISFFLHPIATPDALH